MTTAEHFRAIVARPATSFSIAGVPWPAYKVISLLAGFFVFVVVGAATMSAGPAVLSGAGAATVLWLTLGLAGSQRP
ncbi:hypothetical protein [Mycobacterium sp. NAZ190054]|uniref:hypothetical protein n=1 Tax=Mycobacterium sp. NAZ190054 TaxID=1747766 RepID=UPI000796B463|nr:hypothetical protein [Mycobacterium sp. NAZ190054]KWX57019.1 hypothetical protein ASJ79_12665 [Mycobacterium sp. NAZ190054]